MFGGFKKDLSDTLGVRCQVVPQGEALHLAGRGLRQGVDRDDPARRLNAAMRSRQYTSIAAASIVRPERGTTKATTVSRPSALRRRRPRFEHVVVLHEHVLHFGGRDPDATRLDHVVVAAEERPVAVVGDRVHVAGPQPFAAERERGGIGPFVVPVAIEAPLTWRYPGVSAVSSARRARRAAWLPNRVPACRSCPAARRRDGSRRRCGAPRSSRSRRARGSRNAAVNRRWSSAGGPRRRSRPAEPTRVRPGRCRRRASPRRSPATRRATSHAHALRARPHPPGSDAPDRAPPQRRPRTGRSASFRARPRRTASRPSSSDPRA